jgi:DNA-binding response OmpR family regulator
MARLAYDSVEALIYDPVSANRTATRAALYALGFRRTDGVATLEACMDAIQKRAPDIVLCEAQGAGEELCAAIQDLRQGGGCDNPFIVVIVTAWEKSTGLINRVVNSGADDLLLRPFSTALLGQRIEAHIERRKGFVITTDYVGPDRRQAQTRTSNSAESFEPPNSLKMKAKEKLSAEDVSKRLDVELKLAREKLYTEKLRRDSFQICILWRLMQEQPSDLPAVRVDLERLISLTHSIERRCQDTEYGAVVECCQSVRAAITGLEQDRNAAMHLLGHAALAMHAIFHPEQSPAGRIAEIDATVAIIRARTQTAIAS